jgi:hypothetical protein
MPDAKDLFGPELQPFFRQFMGQSDRVTAILGAILMENRLRFLLRAFFIDHSITADMLDPERHSSLTFAECTRLAFVSGLIGSDIKNDLDQIRLVRNAFAHKFHERTLKHEFHELSFEHEVVKTKCAKFKILPHLLDSLRQARATPSEIDVNTRNQFILTVWFCNVFLTNAIAGVGTAKRQQCPDFNPTYVSPENHVSSWQGYDFRD